MVENPQVGYATTDRKFGAVAMPEFSCAALERIMKKAGAARTSASGIEQLGEVLEEYGLLVSQEAVSLARHAGRKTVKKEDIKLAARRIR